MYTAEYSIYFMHDIYNSAMQDASIIMIIIHWCGSISYSNNYVTVNSFR